jgi:chromodomain-helicase-DNA-binding protein 4
MIINISKRYGTTVSVSSARSASSVDPEAVPDPQEEDEPQEGHNGSDDDDDDGYDETDMLAAPRRSGRTTDKAKGLPFSPKKTRSRRILVIDSDQEHTDNDGSETHRPTRRSTRSRKGVKVNLDAEMYSDNLESEGETSDDYGSRTLSKRKGKDPKKIVHPKAARPAYGHFRVVADLDLDYSDDDSMPIGEHRDICEKCHQGPAHKLLEAQMKRSKGKGKKKRKTPDDDFEETDDEEKRLTALGGWVRWWVIIFPLLPR